MRAVGIITEYNPFHNGHQYHVQQARRTSGADVVVAVMSGHFLQRGEPALVDKWSRAQMALRCGVDVVVELPVPFSCNSAPHFARGAVQILDLFAPRLDCLCFGSESGDLDQLCHQAQWLDAYDKEQHDLAARNGQTFPQARAEALEQADCDVASLNRPNNILSLAYLRALTSQGSRMRPLTIARQGAGYHDLTPGCDGIASATAIRHLLCQGEDVQPYMPAAAWKVMNQIFQQRLNVDLARWFAMVLHSCLSAEKDGDYYQFQPGMTQRIFQAALVAENLDACIDAIKARHLTRTRVQRLLCYQLLRMDARTTEAFLHQPPPYVQLLGTTQEGEKFLRQCRRDMPVPLINNFSRITAHLNRRYAQGSCLRGQAEWLLELENRATRLYTLLLPGWQGGSRQWNYFREPYRC